MGAAFVSTGEPLNVIVLRQGSQTETNSIIERSRADVILTLERDRARDERRIEGRVAGFAGAGGVRESGAALGRDIERGDPRDERRRGAHAPERAARPGALVSPGLRELTVSRVDRGTLRGLRVRRAAGTGKASWTVVGVFGRGADGLRLGDVDGHRRRGECVWARQQLFVGAVPSERRRRRRAS